MSKHTPGPWSSHFEEAYYVTGPDLGRVAMMMNLKGAHGLGGRRSGDEAAANCRLIAAAPDLLEALREAMDAVKTFHGPDCWDIYEQHSPEMKRWRAAIAKATGSTA